MRKLKTFRLFWSRNFHSTKTVWSRNLHMTETVLVKQLPFDRNCLGHATPIRPKLFWSMDPSEELVTILPTSNVCRPISDRKFYGPIFKTRLRLSVEKTAGLLPLGFSPDAKKIETETKNADVRQIYRSQRHRKAK